MKVYEITINSNMYWLYADCAFDCIALLIDEKFHLEDESNEIKTKEIEESKWDNFYLKTSVDYEGEEEEMTLRQTLNMYKHMNAPFIIAEES